MNDDTIMAELFKLNRNIEDLIRKVDELTFALRLSNQRGFIPSSFERGLISELYFDTDYSIPKGMIKKEYPKDGFSVNYFTELDCDTDYPVSTGIMKFDREEEDGKNEPEGN